MRGESKRVLVCPLNWGLGHATRDISIIKHLLEAGHSVSIAGEEPVTTLLKEEFPQLSFLIFQAIKLSTRRATLKFYRCCISSQQLLGGLSKSTIC